MIKDKDIRFKFIKDNRDFFESGIFINEYGINNKNVVDFALFKDNYLYGYEIKSEADNLKRLIGQLKSYLKFFDYIYLIIHEKHKEETYSILKKFKLSRIGVILVDNNLNFIEDKEATTSNNMTRLRGLLNNLKKEDLLELCEAKKLKHHSKYKEELTNIIVGNVTLNEVVLKLEQRMQKSYHRKCNKCGSNLVYKTTIKIKGKTEDKSLSPDKRILKTTYYNTVYSKNIDKCINCDNIFNEKIIKILEKTVTGIKVKKLCP